MTGNEGFLSDYIGSLTFFFERFLKVQQEPLVYMYEEF